jgi:hypothetical protein
MVAVPGAVHWKFTWIEPEVVLIELLIAAQGPAG